MDKTRIKRAIKKALGRPPGHAGPQPPSDAAGYLLGEAARWETLLGGNAALWNEARARAAGGPKVLVATSVGGHVPMTITESMLAVALTLRGAEVHVLLCDEQLPACLQAMLAFTPDLEEFVAEGPQKRLCQSCFSPSYALYQSLGLPVHRYGELVTEEERLAARRLSEDVPADEIGKYQLDGLAVGEHALAGALRFYARGELGGEPHAEAVLRRYLSASLITTYAARRLMRTHKFDSSCFHHGIYVPQGLIGEVARQEQVRVVNWNPAYRNQCFIFSHHDTYHHTLLEEPVSNWEDIDWSPQIEEEIREYLKSRWQGTKDWIWFHEKPVEELSAISAELGVDFSRPCVGLLTNVVWDAQLHYRANAFPNMTEWVLQTIRYFAGRPELQLLIRAHPAEIRGTLASRQPIAAEIQRAFPTLPKNVFLIPPESQVSTYAAMSCCNAVIIYGTKTGVELTSMGIPTIVAGEAWIRNKGITMDARSAEEYFRILDGLPLGGRLSERLTQRARKYAYHFFFRRMIPLSFMRRQQSEVTPYRMDIESIEQLLPGRDAGLDVICEGILTGAEFIYKAESIQDREAAPA